jgi:acyl-CoA synthetase (AMP-forming)/AMP-acid ligase II
VPDDRLGQIGYAWVQLRSGAEVTVDELRAHGARELAAFKVPRQISLVAELPTTSSGKVQKFRLVANLEARTGDRDTEPNHV